VRVAFATNDERTAKRISDALGTATEQRAMRNYAGHRLAPWLAHVMVSRQETARALLTPGEVMQLPPTDELVLVSGTPPIRAQKLRYYEDHAFAGRVLPPPPLADDDYADAPPASKHDWADQVRSVDARLASTEDETEATDAGALEQARHPGQEVEAPPAQEVTSPDPLGLSEEDGDAAADQRTMERVCQIGIARTAYGLENAGNQHELELGF
jgi:type IV secretion system protein VirD4